MHVSLPRERGFVSQFNWFQSNQCRDITVQSVVSYQGPQDSSAMFMSVIYSYFYFLSVLKF